MFVKARAARAERKQLEDAERAKELAEKKAQEVADNLPKWWSTPTKEEGTSTEPDSTTDPTASGAMGATPSNDPAEGGVSLPRPPTEPGAASGPAEPSSGSVPGSSPSPSKKSGYFSRRSSAERKQALTESGAHIETDSAAAGADGHSTPDKHSERRKSLHVSIALSR